MQSIRVSDIPEYLVGSAFYDNLNVEEDVEVSVPQDCCKLDTSVTTAADLEELLRTLRFWGVDRIPSLVLNFIVVNPRGAWEAVLARFVNDLAIVDSILHVVTFDRGQQVCEAVEIGSAEITSCLLEHNFAAVYFDQQNKSKSAVDIAARKGNLEILKVLHQHNCPFTIETTTAAALAGSKLCLEYLLENGCPVAEDMVNFAFASGNLDSLQYVRETVGCNWTDNLFIVLGSTDNATNSDEKMLLQCLDYTQAQGCPNDPESCTVCAERGYVLLLKNLHEHGCPWDEDVVWVAVRKGHVHCLQYAVDNGCPYSGYLLWHAIQCGRVEIISYLREKGLPWSTIRLSSIGFMDQQTGQNFALGLIHAYKLGCPRDPDTCVFAALFGFYDLMVCAHQHGCSMNSYCTRMAAKGNHMDCLRYLHEHGCPWDEETTQYALEYYYATADRNDDCLKNAIEHGCPVSKDTEGKCAALVREGAIKPYNSPVDKRDGVGKSTDRVTKCVVC